MKIQTYRQSFIESVANVAIGYSVALLSQLIIFPLYGIKVTLGTNIKIGIWFTVISIVRSFLVRRIFNKMSEIQIERRQRGE